MAAKAQMQGNLVNPVEKHWLTGFCCGHQHRSLGPAARKHSAIWCWGQCLQASLSGPDFCMRECLEVHVHFPIGVKPNSCWEVLMQFPYTASIPWQPVGTGHMQPY